MRTPLVLLLEDEPVIAADLVSLLRDIGCRVVQAHDWQEALALCAQHTPDVALLNFRQPQAPDGMAVARLLRTYFAVKICFVTGARRSDMAESPDFDAAHPVLFKPFSRGQLRRALAEVLD